MKCEATTAAGTRCKCRALVGTLCRQHERLAKEGRTKRTGPTSQSPGGLCTDSQCHSDKAKSMLAIAGRTSREVRCDAASTGEMDYTFIFGDALPVHKKRTRTAAIAVLQSMSTSGGFMELADIESMCDLAPSSTRRMLDALREQGLVRKIGQWRFELTPPMFLLLRASSSVVEPAHDEAEADADEQDESDGELIGNYEMSVTDASEFVGSSGKKITFKMVGGEKSAVMWCTDSTTFRDAVRALGVDREDHIVLMDDQGLLLGNLVGKRCIATISSDGAVTKCTRLPSSVHA